MIHQMETTKQDKLSFVDFVEKQGKTAALRELKGATSHQNSTPVQRFFGEYDPRTYKTRYPELPVVGPNSKLGRLFASGVAQHHKPLVERTAKEVLPGMFSFDGEVLAFLDELATTLNHHIKPDVDKDGFTAIGVHTNFDRLRCPAGYMQNPMSAKAIDNKQIRKDLGLTPGYTPRQKQIAEAVWLDVWGNALASSVNVPKQSAGGMRRFTHDVGWKLDYAHWKMQSGVYDSFLKMVEGSDVLGLANEFETVYAMYNNKRLQLDEIGKVRLANDMLYAKTGGLRGKRSPTDKRVVINGKEYPKFSAQRVRVIDAGPWSINCDLQAIASSHMKSLFSRYPDVFHVNTEDEIKRVIDGKRVYCSDVSEYDQSMSFDAMQVVFATMREYYPEGMVRSAERLFQSPYYARPLELGGTNGFWIADPMDWSFNMNSGNRSGHAMTSLIAKVNKVIETLFIFDLILPLGNRFASTSSPSSVEGWKSFLLGRESLGLINNGDDEVVWSTNDELMDMFAAKRSVLTNGHYVVGPEVGQGFSGLLLTRKDSSSKVYHPQGKIHTAFEKIYIPERSIGGRMRPFWPIGLTVRINNLMRTDVGREALEIHKHVYRKHLEPRYGTLTGLIKHGYDRMPPMAAEGSAADLAVRDDPDKLHYMYTDDDVSAETLKLVTTNIPKEFVRSFLQRYYTGNLT